MRLGDIDVRDLANRLMKKGDNVEARRRQKRDADSLAFDASAGMMASSFVFWGLSQVLTDMADAHDAVPPVNGRALDLADD
jgi:hypothetical protein